MKTIKDYSDGELRHGIDRCKARLSGEMPQGVMSEKVIKQALNEYRAELEARGVKYIEFE